MATTYQAVSRAAHAARDRGLAVLPPNEDGSKSPYSIWDDGQFTWKPFQSRLATETEFDGWYGAEGRDRRAGLGVVTGPISGNLECFEFDALGRAYAPFKAAAEALELGELVERVDAGYSERTPTGGVHWLYQCTEIAGNTRLALYDSDEVSEATGKPKRKALIETRGIGGFVVLAPSNGRVHPTGGAYEILRGGFATIATIMPEERKALWDLARTFDEISDDAPPDDDETTEEKARRKAREKGEREERRTQEQATGGWEDVVSPLDAYNEDAEWDDILPAGWTEVYRRGDTQYLRRPGKTNGVSATLNRNGSDRLYVFSTSTEFTPEVPYSKFAAHALLEHGGDFKAAVRALSESGVGTFKAWVWLDDEDRWELKTLPNPCPKGGLVRLARAGEGPPEWPPRAVMEARQAAEGRHEDNGDGGDRGDPPPVDIHPPRFNLTDLGNAERLVTAHGRDLRYCHPWAKWIVWDGRRWGVDRTAAARRRARGTVREIYHEALDDPDPKEREKVFKHATASEKRDRIAAMLGLAEAEVGIPVLPEQMNPDPWLFNVRNGTIDLRTGELRGHRREDAITQLCDLDYEPYATCPLWQATLDRFLHRDDAKAKGDLLGFLQRLCGYAMVGVIRDHVLPIAYGSGSNGKSTILGTLLDVFGPEYGMKAPQALLMTKKAEGHPTELADLFGKRLVIAIETAEGGRLDEVRIKELTGGDSVRARRMREDFWEFKPTHTLIMATNHKPVVRGTDMAIWRRLKLIPFTVTMADADADVAMPEKLKAELPGILSWCVRGCLAWQARGLDAPEEVTEATTTYRREQDVLGLFLAERTLKDINYRVKAGELYAEYKTWAENGSERVMTNTAFALALNELGFKKVKSSGNWYIGLGLRNSQDTETGHF